MLPVLTYRDDLAAELVADHGRILPNIVGDTLVVLALDCRLIGGHADGVTDDLHLNVVGTDFGKGDTSPFSPSP